MSAADVGPAGAAGDDAREEASRAAAAAADPPAGFRRFPAERGFIGVNGPLWVRHETREDGPFFRLGFRVEPRHCNPMGICHGGMLATFADMLLPIGAISLVPALYRRFLPTVSLQVDFMAPARLGDWVEGEAQVLRTTRQMVFAQGLVRSGEALAVRCSGVFKIGPEFDRKPSAP
ncbi:MAG: PaaI family thioesterase [Rubrivivax sp.]|nr:PaaI family thioesterase [Rubrivivax sp.]